MIVIDNYDSFTYNIVEYLKELGVNPKVFKNDEITIDELKNMDFESLIISPGAGNPYDKNWLGVCDDVLEEFYQTKKILGICLGHQLVARYFGAKVVQDKNPYHGKVSKINILKDSLLFKGFTDNFDATRYHSLKVDTESLPDCIVPLAKTEDGILMALKIKGYNVFGVQYHPEAILTQYGHELLRNFIEL